MIALAWLFAKPVLKSGWNFLWSPSGKIMWIIAGTFVVYGAGFWTAAEHYRVRDLKAENRAYAKQIKDTREITAAAARTAIQNKQSLSITRGHINDFQLSLEKRPAAVRACDAMSARTAAGLRGIALRVTKGSDAGRTSRVPR